ncbi:MAG: 2-oxo acid dehydrogenase subunit E2 [Gammaproteobacteria bacterium]
MAESKEIRVPDLGDFSDVDVIEILVSPGDTVEVEDGLIVLETDKASMDVPSTVAGTVREVKVAVGDTVNEGDVIAVLETGDSGDGDSVGDSVGDKGDEDEAAAGNELPAGDEASSDDDGDESQAGHEKAAAKDRAETEDRAPQRAGGKSSEAAAESEREAPPSAEAGRESGRELPAIDEAGFSRAHASPSVRKLARELGVDLIRVEGSGKKGRILADDVKAWVKRRLEGRGEGGTGAALPAVPDVDFAKFGDTAIEPLGRVRKISARRLQASWLNLPHVTQHDLADITELEERRQELKGSAAERGIKLTPLAFIIKACVQALKEFPRFNSSLHPDGAHLVMKHYFHIGFAADTENGLVVPVIRDADRKDVYELAKDLAELSAAARDGKLSAEQMQGGTFTVSSLGGIGGTAFTPIINAPEVAILGVSRSAMQPVWNGSEFEPRLMLPLSLSYDHRVIDGADAVRFTSWLADALGDVGALLEAIP